MYNSVFMFHLFIDMIKTVLVKVVHTYAGWEYNIICVVICLEGIALSETHFCILHG